MTKKTPTEVAAMIVPRLLAGERLYRKGVQRDYGVRRTDAAKAIRIAREVLFNEHHAILPIAHEGNGYALEVTTKSKDMFAGEVPQLRGNRTRLANEALRFEKYASYALAPEMGQHLAGIVTNSVTLTNQVLELAEAFAIGETK